MEKKKYLIGDEGVNYIRENLASVAPSKFITSFQKENGIKEDYDNYFLIFEPFLNKND